MIWTSGRQTGGAGGDVECCMVVVAGDGADDWEMGVDAESAGGGGWGWCGRQWETAYLRVEMAGAGAGTETGYSRRWSCLAVIVVAIVRVWHWLVDVNGVYVLALPACHHCRRRGGLAVRACCHHRRLRVAVVRQR